MINGAKKKQKQPRQPIIDKDDLVSTSYFKGLYGLAEGEIEGLADGGKSIFLDGTPLINANGQPNFDGVTWDFRNGTLDQDYIKGFSAVENERSFGVELRHDKPYVQSISNTDLSAVRVRLNFNALREQKTNGDITGYAIEYAIDVQTDGGAFNQVLNNTVRGKASQGFKKSHRIDLPKASKNWTIRVRRITPNRDSDLIADTVSIDAITEIIDANLRYPATAILGLTYNAKIFNNIAKLSVRLKGKLIKVPTNYDPVARTYSGLWDGTFKLAYSNNPAWVFYDICTHKRYGLGERLSGMVDKWRLYQIGQYCDELVDDGRGGKEPRFAINVYIQQEEDAYKVLQNIASVFRGMFYWDGTQIVVDADTPKDPVYTFSAANVVGGEFSYTGTRARDRHTVAKVAWDNPNNAYKTEYELVRDEQAIAKYGIRMLDIGAVGCTSQAQAQRAGKWALKSEQLETRTVSFKTGLQGFIPQVGQVINVADNVFAGRAISGRVVSHNAQSITLDRQAGKVGDSISIGTQTAKITAVNGTVITTDKALSINDDAVWAIISDDLKLMQFRILTIAQNDDATFSITALQYEPQKYDAIDYGFVITPKPITALTATPITAPTSVTISQSVRTHQSQSVTTMTINWTQVQGAVAYRVRWRKDDGNWQTIAKISGQSVDIDGVYSGNYIAEVQAIDAFDNESLATSSKITAITGKVGKPPRLARLTATGTLFGMDLTWVFNAGSGDTNYTEIQVSPDGKSNIATLGTFAYPTDKHTINGLQGNLTQFYRARIVDKLGNASDWTEWVSGTTEAQADKVLDMISGQITTSHLHQDLSSSVQKIDRIEYDLDEAKINLSHLNNDIVTINNRIKAINSSVSDGRNLILGSQVSRTEHGPTYFKVSKNINFENVTSLVLSYDVRFTNAKIKDEQEFNIGAAIKCVLNDGTIEWYNANAIDNKNISSFDGRLSKIIKVPSGKTLSSIIDAAIYIWNVSGDNMLVKNPKLEIGTIATDWTPAPEDVDAKFEETINTLKQTQIKQLEKIDEINVRFDSMVIGGRNLILGSQVSRTEHGLTIFEVSKNINFTNVKSLVMSCDIKFTNAKRFNEQEAGFFDVGLGMQLNWTDGTAGWYKASSVNVENGDSYDGRAVFNIKVEEGKVLKSITDVTMYVWYVTANDMLVKNPKLEIGDIPTDWTPAPEDIDAKFVQTNANISTLQQTVANADNALSQRIDALEQEIRNLKA